jgi:predicted nucleic acid-binding protein
MRIYCDSVIIIYYLEGAPPFKARATTRLASLWLAGDTVVISDLVRLECRMQPIQLGDAVGLAQYDALFSQPNVERVAITTAVFDRATVLRAKFRLGDSLHLAAAAESGCDRFLTNDTRLSAFTDIPVEVLP